MSDSSALITSLLGDLQARDPKLYQALSLLNETVATINNELHPPTSASGSTSVTFSSGVAAPINFEVFSTGRALRFQWDEAAAGLHYEIRLGTVWATASFLFRTSGLSGDIDPLLYGSYSYLAKSINSSGVYSSDTAVTTITIPLIPGVIIDKKAIDNNVLLSWSVPVSVFDIDHYKLQDNGVDKGTVKGTFTTFFEQIPADYTYTIIAVDVAGNEGVATDIIVTVNTPPDFALQDTRTSTFSGTKVNLESHPRGLLALVNQTETWRQHYVNNAFTTIRDQINAGFPYFMQPGKLTGSYEEVVNYGVVFNNVLVVVTYNTINLGSSDMTVLVRLATSTDGITYSAFSNGSVQFLDGFQYLKIRIEFTAADNKAMIIFNNLTFTIDVKRDNDGGDITALSTDAGGTEVFFNKTFKDIESITATVESVTEPFHVIYDFTDVPNPTSFFLYVFDTTGNRVTKLVSWKARGVV